MKVIVFGATGTIGRQLVSQLLEQGHTVTAFSRNPKKLSITHPNLLRKSGNVLEYSSVAGAIAQHDAVFCALGDGNKGTTRALGTNNIVKAMERNDIKRLIVQTTLGLGESEGNLNFFWKKVMFGFLLKKAFQDHQLQEGFIVRSSLDYTIVRPSAFTNNKRMGKFQVGFDGSVKNLSLKISRSDVASFMIRQLHSADWMRTAVSISN